VTVPVAVAAEVVASGACALTGDKTEGRSRARAACRCRHQV
jgi:hypothetical protein